MKKAVIWLPLLGAATYLLLLLRRQKKLINESCFKIVNAKVKSFGLYKAEIELKLLYKNKSDINFKVSNQNYELFIEGKPVSKISNDKKYEVPAKEEVAFWLNVKFDPSKVVQASLSGLKKLIMGYGNINMTLKGKIKVESGGIFFTNINIMEDFTLGDLLRKKGDAPPC